MTMYTYPLPVDKTWFLRPQFPLTWPRLSSTYLDYTACLFEWVSVSSLATNWVLTGALVTNFSPAGQHKGLPPLVHRPNKSQENFELSLQNFMPTKLWLWVIDQFWLVLSSVWGNVAIVPCDKRWPASQESSVTAAPAAPVRPALRPCKQTKAVLTDLSLTTRTKPGNSFTIGLLDLLIASSFVQLQAQT